jgi:hypothetical protein
MQTIVLASPEQRWRRLRTPLGHIVQCCLVVQTFDPNSIPTPIFAGLSRLQLIKERSLP